MSRHKLHDFIDSFSHANNKYTGDIVAPSNVMLQYTMQLEETFVKHFSNLQKVSCVGHDLLQLLESIQLDQPCDSFNKKYLLMLFTRLRIYYWTSEVCKQRAEVTRKEE